MKRPIALIVGTGSGVDACGLRGSSAGEVSRYHPCPADASLTPPASAIMEIRRVVHFFRDFLGNCGHKNRIML